MLVCFIPFICIAAIFTEGAPDKTLDHTDNTVVTLQDSQGIYGNIHGGLFFISGHFGQAMYFSWYTKEQGGYFKSHTINENQGDIRIYEIDKSKTPHVEYRKYEVCSKSDSWVIPFDFKQSCHINKEWNLYVPSGTIAQGDFALDAK